MSTKTLVERFDEVWTEDPVRFETLPGTSSGWPATKLVKLYSLIHDAENPPNHQTIADALKVNRSTISRKAKAMDWSIFEASLAKLCYQNVVDNIGDAAEKVRIEALADHALKGRKNDIDTVAMLKHIENRILTETPPIKKLSLPNLIRRSGKRTGTPETAVLLLSDLHVGQEFTKADTSDLNEYNIDIFYRRADNLRKALVEIMEIHRRMYDLPELRIFALGDFVQGGNLNGQWGPAYNSNIDVTEQTIISANIISEAISTWSNMFDNIKLTGVIGNHGRAGAGKNTDKVSASWDKMAYALMKAKLSCHKNIEINYSDSWWATEKVHNTNFLLVHGDGVQGSVSSLHREEQRFQSLIGKPFDYLCMGHFHTFQHIETSRGGVLVNGSFVGGDVHSMHQLRCKSKPTQLLFGVHPDRGMTWNYMLNLDFKRE